jgi:hypothetical protein
MSVMPGRLGIGYKRARPSLPFTQGCSGVAVETAAGLNRTPLGLNRSQEHFWLRTLFVIVVPRAVPSPKTGQEMRRRFVNCPIRACGGNRWGALRRTYRDGWCRRRLGSSQALYKSWLPQHIVVHCHSSPDQWILDACLPFFIVLSLDRAKRSASDAPKERRPLRHRLFDQGVREASPYFRHCCCEFSPDFHLCSGLRRT